MIEKLLPIILLIIGTGAGVGAGVFLRPPPEPAEMEQADADGEATEKAAKAEDEPSDEDAEEGIPEREYAKLNNQFVIPLVEEEVVSALVVMSLSIEVEFGHKDEIFRKEPKLRDSFLQVMFDHANIGGFNGAFTTNENLEVLRSALREVAKRDGGDTVTDVLILEIARQDY